MRPEILLRAVCITLSGLAILAGCGGMVASFLFMTSQNMADVTAGGAGFIAGAVLLGAGLVSLALIASALRSRPG